MNKKHLAVYVVVVIALGIGLYSTLSMRRDTNNPPGEIPEGVVCTLDAMQCPDGSYVGRTGPNCEFVCPKTPVSPTPAPVVKFSNTAKLGEKVSYNGLFITPLKVTEDSRCPVGVQCIWAGRVVLNAKLERNGKTQEFIFDSIKQNVVTFEGKAISLVEVGPSTSYTFTFSNK